MIAGRCWIFLASISLAATWFMGCDSMPGRPTQADYPLRPSAVVDFSALYSENCAGCHGTDGKLGAAFALNNPVYMSIIDDGSMTKIIAQGVHGTAMPPFAQSSGGMLTDGQIAIIVDGIRKRWTAGVVTGAPPYLGAGAGDPERGAKVYAT